jgi:hypothetical protein
MFAFILYTNEHEVLKLYKSDHKVGLGLSLFFKVF